MLTSAVIYTRVGVTMLEVPEGEGPATAAHDIR